jgi:integrase
MSAAPLWPIFKQTDRVAPLVAYSCGTVHLSVVLLMPITVSSIVRRALIRAGMDFGRTGAHLFRQTLAVDLLRNGASLDEIGDVLGHRSPNTTALYAKVDVASLRAIALPWPGGAR